MAATIFAPNLIWQAQHHWMTFAFQFGRIGNGAFTGRYLAEFFAAQAGLATPFIFVLACAGLWRATKSRQQTLPCGSGLDGARLFPVSRLARPGTGQLAVFSLSDSGDFGGRCFRYQDWHGLALAYRLAAAPLAGLLLVLVYGQALFGWLPLRNDPFPRLLGRAGSAAFAAVVAQSTRIADAAL